MVKRSEGAAARGCGSRRYGCALVVHLLESPPAAKQDNRRNADDCPDRYIRGIVKR
jgi:hypothetical protein